ncbi:MAG: adenosylcobinamide-phosphate synthase CbiB [Pseudomonadota bacterium]
MTLILAMIADAIIGDPKMVWSRIPHPVVLMGRAITFGDECLNTGSNKRAKGALLVLALGAAAVAIGMIPRAWDHGWIIDVALAAVLLAQRSLVEHVSDVAQGLVQSVPAGRDAVSMIVGRDTSGMTETEVARAAIESAAENLSDGVIAPILWFCLLGLPGLLLYKVVNTADSMIGYKTPKHRDFGWAAARLDDVLNWVPARSTALLFMLVSGRFGVWRQISHDAQKHRSPNAGWPEAAMAQALGIALSGPRTYNGRQEDHPFVNATGRKKLGPPDILASIRLLWRVWGVVFGVALIAQFWMFIPVG